MSHWAGQRVTIMGLGRFGGGVGVAAWLASQGAKLLVTDLGDLESLAEPLALLRQQSPNADIEFAFGAHDERHFAETDVVVVNPAVPKPWANRYVLAAKDAGVRIATEIRLLIDLLPNRDRVIGVTGSMGKSTTSAMIAHALATTPEGCEFGGNIGGSLLSRAASIPQSRWIVLELSSAMLWWLNASRELCPADEPWSPGRGVVTTLAPNHLDWHGSAEHYEAAKRSLAANQRPGDVLILGPQAPEWATTTGARAIRAQSEDAPPSMLLPGDHNRDNAATALAALKGCMPTQKAAEAVASFPGLPHRLQSVGEFNAARGRVRAFNDSKATTPEATVRAFEAVRPLGPVRLIAGGYDKGVSLEAINNLPLAGLYTIGATAGSLRGTRCDTLDFAVRAAMDEAEDGDVILLSPGCASWDQFTDYTQRGERFIEMVQHCAKELTA